MTDPSQARPQSLMDLFISFSLLALQGFGGVVAIAQRELVERKQWLTQEEFLEEWSVAQIMPGPNVVNMSLMIGGRYFGLPGALAALAGMLVLPLILLLALAVMYAQFAQHPGVAGALRGMSAVSAGLLVATGCRLMSGLQRHPLGWLVYAVFGIATFVAMVWLHWPLPYVLLVLGGAACLLTYRKLRT